MSLDQYRSDVKAAPALIRTGDRVSLSDYREMKSSTGANKPKRSKYGAKKASIDGITFDSTLEANRYSQLRLLEKARVISDLRLQVPYELIVNNILVAKYVADFVYFKDGTEVVEDSKGFLTTEYRLKKKLMKAIHDIDIYESSTAAG
jgi:hypothetical protein